MLALAWPGATALAMIPQSAATGPLPAVAQVDTVAMSPTAGAPDAATALKAVQDSQLSAYRQALARYDAAASAAPGDVSIAVARCEFIGNFTDEESGGWIESAWPDFEACAERLAKRWPNAPAAHLFAFEQLWGEEATTRGEQLLMRSDAWPGDLRKRLAAKLSEHYGYDDKTTRAGELAVVAASLGDAERVSVAVEHLVTKREFAAAQALLRAAPAADSQWSADRRIQAALGLTDRMAAVRELRRYDGKDFSVGAAVAARAHLKAGDAASARKVLQKQSGSTPALREARFETALASGNIEAAAAEIDVTDSVNFAANFQRFAMLAGRSPSSLFSVSMLSAVAVALAVLLAIALSPGLLLIPVHYRGLVRRVKGRRPVPMFDSVGLRQAWSAVAVMLCVPLIVLGLLAPESLAVALSGETLPASSVLAKTAFWGALAGLLVLSPAFLGLGRRHVFGNRDALRAWWRVLLAWGLILLVGMALAAWNSKTGDTQTMQTKMVKSLVSGGGSGFATLVAFVSIAVLAPIFEELVFRGLLLGGMARHISFGWANLLQAVLFAAIHDDAPRFAYYLTMGLLAGWLVRKTRALSPAIALHVLNNALAFVLVAQSG